MKRKGAPLRYDVAMSAGDDMSILGEQVAHLLAAQGFAALRTCLAGRLLQEARAEATMMGKRGDLRALPSAIAAGLLGEEGSARMVPLGLPGEVQSSFVSATACAELGEFLCSVAAPLSDPGALQWMVGAGCSLQHDEVLLHEAGVLRDEPPELTQEVTLRWLETFTWQRLLLVLFLGPGRGVLELQPFDEEGAPLRLHTEPGMLVVLRADQLWHRYSAPAGNFALSCFVAQRGRTGVDVERAPPRPPPALQLESWLESHLEEIVGQASELDGTSKYMVEHLYHTGRQFAVRGVALRCAGTYDPEAFWCSQNAGTDIITPVPITRWDHTAYYEDDPDAWRRFKVNVNHCSLMEGLEMFDAKFFRISPAETKGCDPMQRQILEVGYTALAHAGRTAKSLLQSLTAVYVACHSSEFTMIDTGPAEEGGCEQRAAGTGVSGSIMSNRFSFIFGMMGPSMTFDVEAASTQAAVEVGCVALHEEKQNATMSSVTGVTTILTPLTWYHRIGLGHMGPMGRCLSFDGSAVGWVKSELAGSLAIDNLTETVDGVQVQDDSRYYVGTFGSTVTKHMGVTATLGTPNAPAVQSVIADACRHAHVSPASIDAVECHADGRLMNDAVEVAASSMVLCDEKRLPLGLSSVKSGYGNGLQASSMSQFMKVLYGQAYGWQVPTQHLRMLNPHLVLPSQKELFFNDEIVLFPTKSSLVGVTAIGWGGTICHSICSCGLDPHRRREAAPAAAFEPLAFWPGGGGFPAFAEETHGGYHIVGSWSGWAEPVPMKKEKDGLYSHTVVLGANCFEDFQIWCCGDAARIIHPGMAHATSGSWVYGPDEHEHAHDVSGCSWRIDGRVLLYDAASAAQTDAASENAIDTEAAELAVVPSSQQHLYQSSVGVGDRYRVHFTIAGKWRSVVWFRLPEHAESIALALAQDPSIEGSYQIVGDFNLWVPQDMACDQSTAGLYTADFRLLADGGCFQIVRNRDWSQVFHPVSNECSVKGGEAFGPSDADVATSWWIGGTAGDTVSVEFRRSLKGGVDERAVLWKTLNSEPLGDMDLLAAQRRGYCVVGSWDRWSQAHAMSWNGEAFTFTLQVGSAGAERFQILASGDWDHRLFPSVADACLDDGHTLCDGDADTAEGYCWIVGSSVLQAGGASRYEISLAVEAAPSWR
eukprot:CAMPEP_0203899414 /NCGR_PEP_ID=MMETSP0359-20131031/41833_1 /ASSEMBLY_ACC=CAM_ASM_000338 /TAXON_ID=268821 /ORGANISM="Scrippsiella Hangoei, Strain SHTV-5" /LENGTH=1158 /DNA_ID=CAMNT_0050822657 /DNA_START=62 /DNA_END=3535 /DNA_ORIENTATION=+